MNARLSRDEQRAQTRDRLLTAAARLFAAHGYDGVSIDAIAAEAGFTKGAFYSNFDSKELAFLALLDRHMTGESAALETVLADVRKHGGALVAVEHWLDRLNTDQDWALLSAELQRQAHRSPALASAYGERLAAHRAHLGQLIAALFDLSGKALPMRSEVIAEAFMALCHGLAVQRAAPASGADPAGAIIQVILKALLEAAPPHDGSHRLTPSV